MSGGSEEYRPLSRTKSLSVHDLHGGLNSLSSPLEQAVLQQLHNELLRVLPGNDLAPHLYQRGLITPFEHEQFRAKLTLTEKNQLLLESLRRRPAGMLQKLITCLTDNNDISGAEEIAKTVAEKLEEVSLEVPQSGNIVSWQTEAQKTQVNIMGNSEEFNLVQYLSQEIKGLRRENEALVAQNKELKRKLKKVSKKIGEFKVSVTKRVRHLQKAVTVGSSDTEEYTEEGSDTDCETHVPQSKGGKKERFHHRQGSEGLNTASDMLSESSRASSSCSVHSNISQGQINAETHPGVYRHILYQIPSHSLPCLHDNEHELLKVYDKISGSINPSLQNSVDESKIVSQDECDLGSESSNDPPGLAVQDHTHSLRQFHSTADIPTAAEIASGERNRGMFMRAVGKVTGALAGSVSAIFSSRQNNPEPLQRRKGKHQKGKESDGTSSPTVDAAIAVTGSPKPVIKHQPKRTKQPEAKASTAIAATQSKHEQKAINGKKRCSSTKSNRDPFGYKFREINKQESETNAYGTTDDSSATAKTSPATNYRITTV